MKGDRAGGWCLHIWVWPPKYPRPCWEVWSDFFLQFLTNFFFEKVWSNWPPWISARYASAKVGSRCSQTVVMKTKVWPRLLILWRRAYRGWWCHCNVWRIANIVNNGAASARSKLLDSWNTSSQGPKVRREGRRSSWRVWPPPHRDWQICSVVQPCHRGVGGGGHHEDRIPFAHGSCWRPRPALPVINRNSMHWHQITPIWTQVDTANMLHHLTLFSP